MFGQILRTIDLPVYVSLDAKAEAVEVWGKTQVVDI